MEKLNLEKKTLSVVQNVVNVNGNHGYWHITTPKTRISTRTIPIPKKVCDDLIEYKKGCKNYYGFGLSASGYIENKRYTNTFNFSEYIKNPTQKKYELLSNKEKIEEEIFLGLRLTKGIDFDQINKKFSTDIYTQYKKEFDKYLNIGLMQKTPNGVKLSQKGILLSNEILCDFIN